MKPAAAKDRGVASVSAGPWLSRGRVFTFLGCYFLLQVVLRVAVSDSAELDESEQLLFTQVWRWGYGSDPPLYTWLQILTFQVLGVNVLALALLKNLLLFFAFGFTYLAAREITGEERLALLALLSLLLFPQITWESQRDLTHSVLATTMAAATFWAAVRVVKSPGVGNYGLLGICVGLGALSKYSYSLVALALGAAAASLPPYRRALLDRRMLLAVGIVVLAVAFHGRWVLQSPEVAFRRPAQVIRNAGGDLVGARAQGLWSLAKCVIMLSAALAAAYWFAFSGLRSAPSSARCEQPQRWILRTLAGVGVAALLVVLILGIQLKDRWFQPIAFLGAIGAALFVQGRLTARAEKRFCLLVGAVALAVLAVLPGIPLAASLTNRPTRLNAPYAQLSAQLERSAGPVSAVVASTRLVGGNLRLHSPQAKVVAPEFTDVTLPRAAPWLVVWDANKALQPPEALLALTRRMRNEPVAERPWAFVEAPFQYLQGKSCKLGYLLVPPAL